MSRDHIANNTLRVILNNADDTHYLGESVESNADNVICNRDTTYLPGRALKILVRKANAMASV